MNPKAAYWRNALIACLALAGCLPAASVAASDGASDAAPDALAATQSDALAATQPDTPVATGDDVPAASDAAAAPDGGSAGALDLVFAANFSSNGDCRLGIANTGCDIFVAALDPATGAVDRVARVTDGPLAESFPAWHPRLPVVYFSVEDGAASEVGYADLVRGTRGTLTANAKQPDVAADGTIVYESLAGYRVMRATLAGDGTTLAGAAALTGVAQQHEPRISADARRVVFYQEYPAMGTGSAQGRLFDVASGRTLDLSTLDGSAHCNVTPAGDLATCQNIAAGGVIARALDADATPGTPGVYLAPVAPAVLAAVDPDFARCTGVTFNYVTFCADRLHPVATAQCSVGAPQPHGANTVFSRLVLVDLSGAAPVYRPIGRDLAARFGGPGGDSFTARCRVRP